MGARTVAMTIAGIFAVMIGASVYGIISLPSDALVPTGFDIAGRPNGFARPLIAFSIVPAVAMVVVAICLFLARGAVARSAIAFRIAVLVPLGGLAITHGLLIAYDLGLQVNVRRMMIFVTGLSLIATGNVFGKIRQNRWVGITTPWTLRDEWVWDRTQRFGGWIFVSAGTALALSALVIPAGPVLLAIEVATLAVIVIVPSAKSYLLWRKRGQS
jgi:uncharacterized membrane protein